MGEKIDQFRIGKDELGFLMGTNYRKKQQKKVFPELNGVHIKERGRS